MGRNKFGPQRGPWTDLEWRGWWGAEPPFHTPVFVLTHHPRPTFTLADTTFHFVDATPQEALRQAMDAAELIAHPFKRLPLLDAGKQQDDGGAAVIRAQTVALGGHATLVRAPDALRVAQSKGLEVDLDDMTFFLGRETILVTNRRGMAIWREKLFVLMTRNAVRATAFFRLPPERVVELGVQVEL